MCVAPRVSTESAARSDCSELAVASATAAHAGPCLPCPCRIHYKPRLPLHGAENLSMAFDFMKVKEKIHIVNIGKCGPEREGKGRGGQVCFR